MIKPTWISTGLTGIVFATLFFFMGKGCGVEPSVTSFDQEAQMLRSENGYLIAQAKAQEVELKSLKAANKKLLKEINVKRPEKIVKVTKVIRDTILLEKDEATEWAWNEEPADTILAKDETFTGDLFSYEDEWIKAVVKHYGFAVALDYEVKDSISLVEYKDKGSTLIRAVSHNPNTTITGLDYKVKKKRIGIGLQSGVTWDGKVKPYVGVGISWNFIRL